MSAQNHSSSFNDSFTCADAPAGTVFCDDFESTEPLSDRYFENSSSNFLPTEGVGRGDSRGLRAVFDKGTVGAGNIKKSFGRTPSNYIGKHAVNPDKDYDEIYWRFDVRTQLGWQGGGGNKLSRATTFAGSKWEQGMIAHLWSDGPSGRLTMDPASGIDLDGNLATTKYNDFSNLRWLENKTGDLDLFSTENSGRWFCVEAHIKLNTPGNEDGVFEFWIDEDFQQGSYDLNWHGTWNSDAENFKINAIFIENYWNAGSPVAQERYIDNFIISTKPIGCDFSLTRYTLAASTTGNGNVSGVGTYDESAVVRLTAVPDSGWRFERWEGSLAGTANPSDIIMNGDEMVTAVFTKIEATAPVITLVGLSPVNIMQDSNYTDAGATATDDVDGNISANITVENSVNTAVPGTYVITYNVSDAMGNAATEVTRTVIVEAAIVIDEGSGAGTTGGGAIHFGLIILLLLRRWYSLIPR